jgi:putative transposase
MCAASFYKWRAQFGGMDDAMMTRMKELEDENKRLKKMYIEAKMQADFIKEAMSEIL